MISLTKDIFVKHSLGKTFLLFILLIAHSTLYAEEFSYDIHTDTNDVYLKEGVLLSVDIKQTDPTHVLLFQFAVTKSDAYRIYPLRAQHDDTLHATMLHASYLIYPLKTGDVNITFSLVKRVTDDVKVAHFASGDRDDFKKLETKDIPITLAPLTLHVKALPAQTQLIGDFTLRTHIQSHEAEAFAPIAMRVLIEGTGYPPALKELYKKDKTFTLFMQAPVIEKTVTQKGIHYKVSYIMALSARKDFTLPALHLHAFNPKTQTPYMLSIPAQRFNIQSVQTSALVDKHDSPKKLEVDWSGIQQILTYFLIFVAGYVSALSLKWKKQNTVQRQNPLVGKIMACKDSKSLLQLLMAQNVKTFDTEIALLEDALYHEEKINFKTIKQALLEKLT